MEDLRFTLLLLGLALLGILFLWERRRRARKDEWELPPDADLRGDPVLPDETRPEDAWEIIPLHARRDSGLGERELEQMRGIAPQPEALGDDIPTLTDVVTTSPAKKPLPDLVVALTVIADSATPISGQQLLDATRLAGMSYGAHRIFHRMVQGEALFSMANILEPGYFDLAAMESFSTPGLALFMRLPGKSDGSIAVKQMVDAARLMAQRFNGRLCDERRRPLTEQDLARLLDKARPYRATAR